MRSSVDVSPPYARRELTRVLQAAALAALVLVAVVTQIPSSLSLRSSNAIRSPEASTTNKFEHMFATKTKYWNQRKDETDGDESAIARALVSPPVNADIFNGPPFHELELIQTQIVARHGIR
ncbi:unnamed protein product [Phytophthora lilii]|uniref:Unnamed protein product n=1 Tax=Phytophthora lilii TaxID=2077276 RepID=A0A9W6T9Z4_9STRA|nr:unnamed protein product [Phytophthora lilii]